MSKAEEYVEKVRESWGESNDGENSGLDADLLDGKNPSELPVSNAVQAELDAINSKLANTPTGTWTFDGTTLSITGVPAP